MAWRALRGEDYGYQHVMAMVSCYLAVTQKSCRLVAAVGAVTPRCGDE